MRTMEAEEGEKKINGGYKSDGRKITCTCKTTITKKTFVNKQNLDLLGETCAHGEKETCPKLLTVPLFVIAEL